MAGRNPACLEEGARPCVHRAPAVAAVAVALACGRLLGPESARANAGGIGGKLSHPR
jgi:hypothetical protein